MNEPSYSDVTVGEMSRYFCRRCTELAEKGDIASSRTFAELETKLERCFDAFVLMNPDRNIDNFRKDTE